MRRALAVLATAEALAPDEVHAPVHVPLEELRGAAVDLVRHRAQDLGATGPPRRAS